MPGVFVDSNVLIDLVGEPNRWTEWSSAALQSAAERSRLVINIVVYAEVSIGYRSIEQVEGTLPSIYVREPIPEQAAFLAGKAYDLYRRRGGARTSPLPDFFIGAHAAVAGHELLTRDPARYRSYFPSLKLIAPD